MTNIFHEVAPLLNPFGLARGVYHGLQNLFLHDQPAPSPDTFGRRSKLGHDGTYSPSFGGFGDEDYSSPPQAQPAGFSGFSDPQLNQLAQQGSQWAPSPSVPFALPTDEPANLSYGMGNGRYRINNPNAAPAGIDPSEWAMAHSSGQSASAASAQQMLPPISQPSPQTQPNFFDNFTPPPSVSSPSQAATPGTIAPMQPPGPNATPQEMDAYSQSLLNSPNIGSQDSYHDAGNMPRYADAPPASQPDLRQQLMRQMLNDMREQQQAEMDMRMQHRQTRQSQLEGMARQSRNNQIKNGIAGLIGAFSPKRPVQGSDGKLMWGNAATQYQDRLREQNEAANKQYTELLKASDGPVMNRTADQLMMLKMMDAFDPNGAQNNLKGRELDSKDAYRKGTLADRQARTEIDRGEADVDRKYKEGLLKNQEERNAINREKAAASSAYYRERLAQNWKGLDERTKQRVQRGFERAAELKEKAEYHQRQGNLEEARDAERMAHDLAMEAAELDQLELRKLQTHSNTKPVYAQPQQPTVTPAKNNNPLTGLVPQNKAQSQLTPAQALAILRSRGRKFGR